jgi:hypothetical protein
VAVEKQHKTLEQIPESYDCEPENFSSICDPDERIVPLSDSQRWGIVRKGTVRPELSDEEYPKDKEVYI